MIAEAVFWLSLNIFHEARGEPQLAQIAVAQTVLNRTKDRDMTVEQVIKEKHQFSWRLDRKKRKAKPWKTDPETFLACSVVAVQALTRPDITGGSTHFRSPMKRPPKWARKMTQTRRYGKLTFYKERT